MEGQVPLAGDPIPGNQEASPEQQVVTSNSCASLSFDSEENVTGQERAIEAICDPNPVLLQPPAAAASDSPIEQTQDSALSQCCVLPEASGIVPRKHKTTFKRRAAEYESRGQGDVLDSFSTAAPIAKVDSEVAPDVMADAESTPLADQILDSWEDVGAITAPAPAPPPSSTSAVVTEPMPARITYTKARLLELRVGFDATAPVHLPSFVVERSTSGSGDSRAGRRLGPGGATRGGGAGAGGGGSGGGRYSGSMDDPRRDQNLRYSMEGSRGARGRKTDHAAASDKWDRGQRVKQKDGAHEQWGPEPVEPLKTTANRWDRKRRGSDVLEVSLNQVTSILNKMTPENFEKLSGQLCNLEMTSSEMLRRVIGVLFDKAVDEPHFAVVYAALCARLAEATRVWPFIRSVKDETAGTWSWVADLDVDTSRLLPLPDFAAVASLFGDSDTGVEAIGVGQLQLQPSDCFLKENTLVCCYLAEQRPGVVRHLCHAHSDQLHVVSIHIHPAYNVGIRSGARRAGNVRRKDQIIWGICN